MEEASERRLGVVRLKQVARPGLVFGNPREPSAPRSQQAETTTSREPSASSSPQSNATNIDTSPSNSSAVQLDEIQVSQARQNRISSLPKRHQAKRRSVSSLLVMRRKKASNGDESDVGRTKNGETESEIKS
jgi:hypothetical protein